ncbi:MAG TPA: class I SAM-dependent methyltransferase [Flavobacteriales bacterium]|nr:class I SAM-dependent methyltransferase [Flavobacteriales bacterium]
MSALRSPLSGKPVKKTMTVKDFLVSQKDFDLYYDADWDMLMTLPVPENLASYYESKDYKPHQHQNKSILNTIYNFIRRRNYTYKLNLIKKYHPKATSVLDYGTATGEFLKFLLNKKMEVAGVEPNGPARRLSNSLTANKVKSNINEISDTFDIITLWHVLEHVQDIDTLIDNLKKRLNPGGKILIAVPNFKSYDAMHYQNYWAAYDVPRHLWQFSPTSIKALFSKHQMTVIDQKPLFFDSFYVSLLSEQYKYGTKRFLPAFITGLKSNIKARRSGQYSSLIYIVSK